MACDVRAFAEVSCAGPQIPPYGGGGAPRNPVPFITPRLEPFGTNESVPSSCTWTGREGLDRMTLITTTELCYAV